MRAISRSRCWLLFGLLLLANVVAEDELVDSKANLEDYMRFTPAPNGDNETLTLAPTSEPSTGPTETTTIKPTTAQPTSSAPTNSPSQAPSTREPSTPPTKAPTTAEPSQAPNAAPRKQTSAPSTEEPVAETEVPSEAPSETAAVVETAESEEDWDLFSETLEYQSSIGEVFVDFSLYSPNVTNIQMNFMKLKMGVCQSIVALVCAESHPIQEGSEYCAVRDDVLLRDGTSQARTKPLQLTEHDVTVMALASTNVKDGSGALRGTTSISWTTWRLSYNVLQLGPALRQYINETHGPDMDEEELSVKGLSMLQQMMAVNMERTLRDGIFEHDINVFMNDIMLLTSVVGEEVRTYEAIMLQSGSSAAEGLESGNGEDEEGGGLMVVFFFAGLGVACFVIVTLLYFSFRSRRSVVRRKRTIVILDDTSKSCTDSQDSTSDQDRVVVVDTKGAPDLQEDAPKAQQETTPPQSNHQQQQWEGASSVGATSSVGAGEAEADVESQWGRSMAQSSAYTGSISAITGVSGLEQSDTWSVGSMSIDLAEWG